MNLKTKQNAIDLKRILYIARVFRARALIVSLKRVHLQLSLNIGII